MADHKAFKEQAAAEFEELLQMVMERLAEKDPSVIDWHQRILYTV